MSIRSMALWTAASVGIAGLAAFVGPKALRAAGIEPATAPATRPASQPATPWRSLFDGKSLEGWKATDYAGAGEAEVADGAIVLSTGERLTGVTWTGAALPKVGYEISLTAKRVNGSDFFCGLTFPVKDSFATLVVGGWGGALVGISSLDGADASHNETSTARKFATGPWYAIRVRVLPDRLVAWIDDDKVIDVSTAGKKVEIRADIEESKPLGLASFQTTAAIKDIKIRDLSADEVKAGAAAAK